MAAKRRQSQGERVLDLGDLGEDRILPEALLDDELLTVVGPSFDEQGGGADIPDETGAELSRVEGVRVVARVHLMGCDVAERDVVQRVRNRSCWAFSVHVGSTGVTQ